MHSIGGFAGMIVELVPHVREFGLVGTSTLWKRKNRENFRMTEDRPLLFRDRLYTRRRTTSKIDLKGAHETHYKT